MTLVVHSRALPGASAETVDLSDITRTVLAVQIVLYYSTCDFIMAGDAFSELSNKGIEGQSFRVAVDSVHQIRGSDNVDFAI